MKGGRTCNNGKIKYKRRKMIHVKVREFSIKWMRGQMKNDVIFKQKEKDLEVALKKNEIVEKAI